jgi:Rne/Rng family ribonuclease
MAKEICISSTPHETRLAILEDDQLAEIYYERENEYTLAGSIYNGRVTRVLPGMQSAFVDVGLERDAFLYVTDFLELEDPEETDELEKAAASGGNQPPREVRHTNNQDGRSEDRNQRSNQKSEQKQEPRQAAPVQERPAQDRPSQDRPTQDRPARNRQAVEAVPEADEVLLASPEASFAPEQTETTPSDQPETGSKRWRGRRRRRGSRGAAQQENQPQTTGETTEIEPEVILESETESAPEFVAAELAPVEESYTQETEEEAPSAPKAERAPRAEAVPFVLPGESLSKYGGTSADDASPAPAAVAPARPASSFKPATLIEVPLEWDGSGLLPGESLSRHKNRSAEPEIEEVPEASHAAEIQETAGQLDERTIVEEIEETVEVAPQPAIEAAPEETVPTGWPTTPAQSAEEEFVEEELVEEELVKKDLTGETSEAAPAETSAHLAPAGTEADAAASHNVDPLPPTGFRLFGLGGKKKKDEEEAPAAAKPAPEEDFIEEEAFSAPRPTRPGKSRDRNQNGAGSDKAPGHNGELGELLHEAKISHRIEIDEEGNIDEGVFEEEDDDAITEGQPSTGEGQGQQRRERAGRGRRGRGGLPNQQGGQQGAQGNRRGGPTRRSSQLSDLPIISDLLKPGQEILVQIAKEPIAKKGARITSHIALPGRFLVFMPTVSHIGVSRKIESDEERQRLKRILVHERGEASGGFIVRTAAEGASEEDLRADLRFLLHLWNEIKTRSDSSNSPALIYHDLSLIERILRDQVSSNFSNIWVDTEAAYERIVRFLNRFSPTLVRRVKLYTKETPLFEHFGIEDEISKALRSKVWLKSGGSIVINQTEALVAIDINTGKYVGKSARLEDTIVKTNLDAVPEIVRQIRLRDLGGIIVIDFIDMDDRKNRYKVMAALEEALKSDRAPTKVLQFNDFGLVAITRKRVKQSLERTLSVPCPTCQATGMVKSPTTVCNEIYTELRKMKKHFEGEDVLLRVHPETVKVLKSNNASWLAEFEELVGKNILVKSDPAIHPEQFDIQG